MCHDVIKTVVSERPEEECQIEPQRNCKHVTKLVPRLQVRPLSELIILTSLLERAKSLDDCISL